MSRNDPGTYCLALARVTFGAAGIELREKKAVGQHLREGVGKLNERQFVEDLVAENLIKAIEFKLAMFLLLPPKLLIKKVAKEVGSGRKR